jgi:hypothetical protein
MGYRRSASRTDRAVFPHIHLKVRTVQGQRYHLGVGVRRESRLRTEALRASALKPTSGIIGNFLKCIGSVRETKSASFSGARF